MIVRLDVLVVIVAAREVVAHLLGQALADALALADKFRHVKVLRLELALCRLCARRLRSIGLGVFIRGICLRFFHCYHRQNDRAYHQNNEKHRAAADAHRIGEH